MPPPSSARSGSPPAPGTAGSAFFCLPVLARLVDVLLDALAALLHVGQLALGPLCLLLVSARSCLVVYPFLGLRALVELLLRYAALSARRSCARSSAGRSASRAARAPRARASICSSRSSSVSSSAMVHGAYAARGRSTAASWWSPCARSTICSTSNSRPQRSAIHAAEWTVIVL